MSGFSLEIGSINNQVSVLAGYSKELKNLADAFKNFDTDNSEGFEFNKAKRIIAGSITNASEKVNNASKILTNIATEHEKFQKLTYSSYIENKAKDAAKAAEEAEVSGSQGSTSGGGSASYSSNSSVSYNTASYSRSGSSSSSATANVAPSYATVASGTVNAGSGTIATSNTASVISLATGSTFAASSSLFEAIGTGAVTVNSTMTYNLDEEKIENTFSFKDDSNRPSVDVIYDEANNPKLKFDKKTGYAMVGDLYVIKCSAEYGKPGDVITVQAEDGSVIKCIIGENYADAELESGTSKLEFYSNSARGTAKIVPGMPSKENKIVNIKNYGQYDEDNAFSRQFIASKMNSGMGTSSGSSSTPNDYDNESDSEKDNKKSIDDKKKIDIDKSLENRI